MELVWENEGGVFQEMKGFGGLKSDYVNRSKRRIQELGLEIHQIEERISQIEPSEPCGECKDLVVELKVEANELTSNVDNLSSLHSESWNWTLEIEDTERLFETLRRRVGEAREFLEENES